MTHAFFADMGGIVLHSADWVPFPVDAKQLYYLVHKEYLPYSAISKAVTKDQIKDKNKADTLLRVITVLQTLWFVLDCLGRKAQGLMITTFELTTLGFIFCTVGTQVCWAHKPADVGLPVVLEYDISIRKILVEADPANEAARLPYSRTPLDFLSREEWSWSLWWSFAMVLLRKVTYVRFQPKDRPITRFPNDSWPALPSRAIFALGFVDMGYAAIYMCGWNFWFATEIERTLWRVSTTMTFAVIVCYLLIESYTFYLLPALPARYRRVFTINFHSRTRTWQRTSKRGKLHAALERARNNSPNKDPQLYMPLKASIPITVTGVMYLFARAYLLIECLYALRKLPSSAYDSVDWSGLLPHV